MRPRKRTNKTLPSNLYCQKKGVRYYYSYRNPKTGKFTAMGSNKTNAVKAAQQLNNRLLYAEADELVERVLDQKSTLGEYLDNYWEKIQTERDLSPNTLCSRKHYVKIIREQFGKRQIGEVTRREISAFIDSIKKDGHSRKAQATRSVLVDIFNSAISDGWTENNPVALMRAPTVKVKRSRLTLDQFKAVLEASETHHQPYAANAMLLAVVTGQRLGDVANMRFKDISDGWLHIRQEKTGMMIRIHQDLRLEALNISLGEVVTRCRDRVVSRYLIHHTSNHGNAPAGSAVHRTNISGWFRKARDLSGIKWDGTPPTFHEIRSLAGRLYKKQGVDGQSLLGHKDARTTSVYNDARGSEWAEVKG